MTFEIYYDKQPRQFLRKADAHISRRIMDKVEHTLANNPVPHGAKAIVGGHGVFRLRIGDYRALYRIDYQERKIIVFEIDKRSRIY